MLPDHPFVPPTALLELVSRHAGVAIAEVGRDGLVRRANEAWLRLTAAGSGADWLLPLAPPDRVAAEAKARDALAAGAPTTVDVRVPRGSGRPRWLRLHLVPLLDPAAGRTERLLLAGLDVTREREVDGAVQGLLRQLDDARVDLDRIVQATDCVPYTFEMQPDGQVIPLPNGHGLDRLLAGDTGTVDWRDVVEPDDLAAYAAWLAGLGDGERYEVEYRVVGADGFPRWVSDTGHARRRDDGGLLLTGAMRDVSRMRALQDEREESVAFANEANAQLEWLNVELEAARAEAEALARTDALTGLANRRYFTEILEAAIAGGRCGLLMLDVDRFKQVNDRHGHAAGDAVLVEVARRMRATLREADIVARIGGEEFVALLSGASEADAGAAAERLRLAIRAAPVETVDGPVLVTASFGATSLDGATADVLLSSADRGLYAAKHRGRDRVVCASQAPEMNVDEVEGAASQALRVARTVVRIALGDDAVNDESADTADLAACTARELGAPPADVLRCRLAGWLHGIGHGAIPTAILEKPGPLDPSEWARVRETPLLAERLIRDVPAIAEAAGGVRHHHERWDGRGYPDGLAGEAIPLEARVVCVVESWHAMTSGRPYRAAMSPPEALAELRRCAGSQFDPAAVEAFARVLVKLVDQAA